MHDVGGFFFRGKDVAVVGGGDSAMKEATFLTRFAASVTVIHRREDFRASRSMPERARKDPKIRWRLGAEVVEVIGDGAVSGLKVRDVASGTESLVAVDGVLACGDLVDCVYRQAITAGARRLLMLNGGWLRGRRGGWWGVIAVVAWGARAVRPATPCPPSTSISSLSSPLAQPSLVPPPCAAFPLRRSSSTIPIPLTVTPSTLCQSPRIVETVLCHIGPDQRR
jgi:hypothetical protein